MPEVQAPRDPTNERLRRQVVQRLSQIAPIVALRDVKLEGLSAAELSALELCFRHIEENLERLRRQVRRGSYLL